MNNEIFISVTEDDIGIAEALQTSIKDLFGETINVSYYKSEKLDSGIRHGQDWFKWILDQVKKCDFAFVLMTPSSVEKSYILWEAGVIYGAAMATTGENMLRPIVYQLKDDQIPLPIMDSHVQYRRGDQAKTVKLLFKEIFEQYKDNLNLKTDQLIDLSNNMDRVIGSYLNKVNYRLVMGPLEKMAKEYLKINIDAKEERTKKKNETAWALGDYVIQNQVLKENLANEENNQGLFLALAEAVYRRPEINDIDLLVRIESKVNRLHIKFRILRSIDQLIEERCIIKEKVPAINQMLKNFSLGADDSLQKKIDLLQFAVKLL